jgi:hypothetical protein
MPSGAAFPIYHCRAAEAQAVRHMKSHLLGFFGFLAAGWQVRSLSSHSDTHPHAPNQVARYDLVRVLSGTYNRATIIVDHLAPDKGGN